MRHLKNILRYIRLIGTLLGAILLLPFYLLKKEDIEDGDADDYGHLEPADIKSAMSIHH